MPRFLSMQEEFRVSKLGEGMCNDNYLVETSDARIVIRLSKPHQEYKAFREYQKEEWCMRKAREAGIPVPGVLKVIQWSDRACMIQSYIEGLSPLSAEYPSVWKTLGYYAKKIHAISVSGWGEHLKAEDGTFDESWDEHLRYNIASLGEGDAMIRMGILTETVSEEVRGLFRSLERKKFQFGLCHGDISLRNTLIDTKGTVCLLDWGCAKAEVVPHYEINEIIRRGEPDTLLQSFLDGYGMGRKEYAGMKDDLDDLALLRDIDTLRWAIDKKPEEISNLTAKVRTVLKRKFGDAA